MNGLDAAGRSLHEVKTLSRGRCFRAIMAAAVQPDEMQEPKTVRHCANPKTMAKSGLGYHQNSNNLLHDHYKS